MVTDNLSASVTSAVAPASETNATKIITTPRTFEEIISPISADEFLNSYWARNFLHIPGAPDRFAGLFPWDHLNHVMEYHRFSPMRLRLFRDGQAIRPREYLQVSDEKEQRLQISDLTRHLAEGATLILDNANELYAPLKQLSAALSRTFQVHAQVNLYAGWRTNRGFDRHWDDHDVFVLQVAGRKRWAIYHPTRLHPLNPDSENPPEPAGLPVWDAFLEPGDFLYLPRGWWHVAFPLDEPCLHLSVGISHPTGLTLLQWFVQSLRSNVSVRQNLPQFATPDQQAAYTEDLRQEWLRAWNSQLIEQYFAEMNAVARAQPCALLPDGATQQGFTLTPTTHIKLAVPRKISLPARLSTGVVHFEACGKQWECDSRCFLVIQLLNRTGGSHSMEELKALGWDGEAASVIEHFVGDMVRAGLFTVDACSQAEPGH